MDATLKGGNAKPKDITVSDIMGEWGAYQWSMTLFGIVYSALFSFTVVVGPMWTPDLSFTCAPANYSTWSQVEQQQYKLHLNFTSASKQRDCLSQAAPLAQSGASSLNLASGDLRQPSNSTTSCEAFVYDDANYGKVLTNSFNLVCSNEWLKSCLSSSALAGMLLSSLTLGRVSDVFGRLTCIRVGVGLSILATIGAIFSTNYLILNAFFLLMSYSQVGAANSLCTLVMESTSPRLRVFAVFEYSLGWALGLLITPLIHQLTFDYQLALWLLLGWQVLMLPWLHWGVFESARWLLSEGRVNRAQIELQRACRWNRIQPGAELAQSIAGIQAQQMRKASRMIEADEAATILARVYDQQVDNTAKELNLLNSMIKSSFGQNKQPELDDQLDDLKVDQTLPTNATISPTLNAATFSVEQQQQQQQQQASQSIQLTDENVADISLQQQRKLSLTTQGVIQLAMKYRKTLTSETEGTNFLIRMFHPKIWRATLLLALMSIMLESSYYGFIQANGFVGNSVVLNYVLSAISEIFAACVYLLVTWLFSRRAAVALPVCIGSMACLLMAVNYQLIPNEAEWIKGALEVQPGINANGDEKPFSLDLQHVDLNEFQDSVDSTVIESDKIMAANLTNALVDGIDHPQAIHWWLQRKLNYTLAEMLALREQINLWLMNIGKIGTCVGIQVAAMLSMEIYPNNLRQTASGAIIFVARVGSILAPFLYNDPSERKLLLKATLVVLGFVGLLTSMMAPCCFDDTKNKELSDRIEDDDD